MHKLALLALVLVLPFFASAHVTVMPSEVGVGERQIFNVSVPTEKDMATVGLRLVIPDGLQSVMPNVKPGWNIELVKMGEGEEAMIREIIWTGGAVPADMRDDFFFRAQAPMEEGTLVWKAYQTYADGSIVSWDADVSHDDASGGDGAAANGPYSQTKIINDLKDEVIPPVMMEEDDRVTMHQSNGILISLPFLCWITLSLVMSGIALILGIRSTMRRRPPQQ